MNLNNRDYLRPKEVQHLLGIGNTKFWNLVREGYFATTKIGGSKSKLVYVRRADIDKLFAKN